MIHSSKNIDKNNIKKLSRPADQAILFTGQAPAISKQSLHRPAPAVLSGGCWGFGGVCLCSFRRNASSVSASDGTGSAGGSHLPPSSHIRQRSAFCGKRSNNRDGNAHKASWKG